MSQLKSNSASSPLIRPNTTSHLIVCGAERETDAWLFGDFLGFTSAIKEHSSSVNGTFINCFDLERYFSLTVHEDVKFGRKPEIRDGEWTGGDEIVVYTRFEFEHRTRWWTQLREDERRTACAKVLEWIRARALETKPGDIVSIILIGHGNTEGIVLGGVLLEPAELAAACSLVPATVQVNIMIKACYSGIFTTAFKVSNQRNFHVHTSANKCEKSYSTRRSISNRVRNSIFGEAIVPTLGLMKDEEERWTLKKQDTHVENQLAASTIPRSRRSTPQVGSDSPKTRLMIDIMYRDYVDVMFSEAPIHARRVLTPQNVAPGLLAQPSNSPDGIDATEFQAASAMLTKEMELVETEYPAHGDEALTDRWFTRARASPPQRARTIVQLVQAIAYRFQIQDQFLVAAESLIHYELVSINALYAPMDLSKDTPSIRTVLDVLGCFSFAGDCMNHQDDILGKPFEAPVRWLATLIVRSCTDWTGILSRLTTIKILGTLDSHRLRQICKKRLGFNVNFGKARLKEVESPQCGFWLPQGTRIRDFLDQWSARYSSVKESYQTLTGREWPDDDIVQTSLKRLLAMEENSE